MLMLRKIWRCKKIIPLLAVLICLSTVAASDDRKKDDVWVSMEERVKIWDDLAGKGNYTIAPNGIEAVYKEGGAQWTIIGANAPIVNPTIYPKDWPVKGDGFEVLVIPEPITNYKILPFTEKIENAVKSDIITITAALDSYEPGSLVIRSGDVDLKDVFIEVTDLNAEIKGKDGITRTVVFPKDNIDVRVVKCWYQAGTAINDLKHKLLTPELLLHDDDLVRVNYDKQADLLKNIDTVQDSEQLRPLTVPRNQNKQVWITAHISREVSPGKYNGKINILTKGKKGKELKLEVEVLPIILPQPMLDYALYYEGYLSGQSKPQIGWRPKTEKQMSAELLDMREHGLTNATVWHNVTPDESKWDEDWKRLKRTLELRREIGWETRPLLYLDWHTAFSTDLNIYKKKVARIASIAASLGIKDTYIYGVDEKKGKDLLALRSLYQAVHEAGAKNFVAGTEDFLIFVPDLLDLPVLNGQPNAFFMTLLNKLDIKALSYGNPQTGLEEPETYRRNYGVKLFTKGFSGALDYVYQHGSCWNDFADNKYRSHTMAYPTVDRPIPTIQWEGWREGVNDVRFLTLLKNENLLINDLLERECSGAAQDCRKNVTQILLNAAPRSH